MKHGLTAILLALGLAGSHVYADTHTVTQTGLDTIEQNIYNVFQPYRSDRRDHIGTAVQQHDLIEQNITNLFNPYRPDRRTYAAVPLSTTDHEDVAKQNIDNLFNPY